MKKLFLILLTAPTVLFASDGVIEISQVDLDTPPYNIQESGSYIITESLNVTHVNYKAIKVLADGVTIDMNGFTLRGPGTGNGVGIFQPATNSSLSIMNGTVSDWYYGIDCEGRSITIQNLGARNNNTGIDITRNAVIINAHAVSNAADGIWGGQGSTIQNCTADYNLDGITLSQGGIYGCSAANNLRFGFNLAGTGGSDLSAAYNGETGFRLNNASLANCHAGYNNVHGFTVTDSTVINCSADANGGNGFETFDSVLSGCLATDNTTNGFWVNFSNVSDSKATDNSVIGFHVGSQSTVLNCESSGHGGIGIYVGDNNNRIEGNNIVANFRGLDVVGFHNLVIKNRASYNPASDSSADYTLSWSNSAGPIVDVKDIGIMTNIPYANHPWANFKY